MKRKISLFSAQSKYNLSLSIVLILFMLIPLLNLAAPAKGFPDETNTGTLPGTNFKTTEQRTITVDNTVIEGEKIIANNFTPYCGGLTIKAKNVVIRNCWIISNFGKGEKVNGTGVISIAKGASVTIEHCTLDGSNSTHAAIWDSGEKLIAVANNIFGTNDGIFIWDADNFIIKDNYIHNLTREASNGHIDGFQTEGSKHGVIQHNTIKILQGQNACVALWNGRLDTDDILVENNLLAGAGFTVYAEDYSPSEKDPVGGKSMTNIRFINNAFSTEFFPNVGSYGAWYPRGHTTDKCIRKGNYVLETGENIDNNQPKGCTDGMP